MTRFPIPSTVVDALAEFHVEAERGFLPSPDPLERLPARFEPWEDIAHDLPKLLVSGQIRPVLERLPVLRRYLLEMRAYMPRRHRAFIETIERGPSIRRYVLERTQAHPDLRDVYNACIHWLERFRSTHLEYAKTYIQKQRPSGANNPVDVGTGGTPFIDYLKKHRDETIDHKIP